MIVFNEGLPGSGKSYDAVVTHILPALKAGRHVYARLNGLDDSERHDKIAAHLGIASSRVRELLHPVTDEEVHTIGTMVQKNALVVIDECHEFYVASREPMAKDKEELFAKHRHHGLDIVLMSQYYKRLHSAVRGRVERKAIFTKLTVVKASNRYKVEHWQAVSPDRYEKVDSVILKYDPAIFPLYKSVEDGTTNMAVYASGSVSAFRRIGMWALVMIPLAIWAVWNLSNFFSRDSSLIKSKHVPGVVASTPAAVAPHASLAPQKSAQLDTSKKKAFDTKGMPAEVAYVFDIASQARPRCAAVYWMEGHREAEGVVEFREDQGHVLERLTLRSLREMGLAVVARSWGVSIIYKGQTIVATGWPVDMPGTISDEQNARTDATPAWQPGQGVVGGQPMIGVAASGAKVQAPPSVEWPHPDFRYQVPFPAPSPIR